MKPYTEMKEGREAFTRFDALVTKLRFIPHSEILRREAGNYRNLQSTQL